MPIERGDSIQTPGASPNDDPSTFEQNTLNGTTTTGNASVVVRNATAITIVDTPNYFTSTTVEGALGELVDDITNLQIGQTSWGLIDGTLSDQTDLQAALDLKATISALSTHESDATNPHSVTATQVGLGNVDNTSDVNKPVSTAQATADSLRLLLTGGTVTGQIKGITPAAAPDLTRKDYVDTADALKLNLTGGTMTGGLNLGNGSAASNLVVRATTGGFSSMSFKRVDNSNATGLFYSETADLLSIWKYNAASTALTHITSFLSDGNISINGTVPTASGHLTRKDYVDLTTPKTWQIVGATGAISFQPTGWTCSRISTGRYRVTHNLGLTANEYSGMIVSATGIGFMCIPILLVRTTNYVEYGCYNTAGTIVDVNHNAQFQVGNRNA